MIKAILTYPKDKEVLTQPSQEVDNIEEIQDLIQDLKDTMHFSGGKGISAIQIGVPKRVCICSWGGQEITMINPVITRSRGNTMFHEGCLSVPGRYIDVPRAQKVWCSYTDENGNKCEIAEGGRMSNIIQHELDHFEGWCPVFED